MLEKKGKIWGCTTEVFKKETFSVHYLNIGKNGYCSEHKHKQKINMFYIISGKLEISIFNDNGITDKTTLTEGQALNVQPGQYHKFLALSEVNCLEIYYPCDISEDIIRRTTGGILGNDNNK